MTTTPEITTVEAEGGDGVSALKAILESNASPLKLVTGQQTNTGLKFDIEPGAIVAHPNSAVLFICG